MSDMEFNETLMEQVEFVRRNFKEKTDSFAPMLVLVSLNKDKDGKREAVLVAFANLPDDRKGMMYKIGEKMAKESKIQPAVAFFMSEAWMSNGERDEKGKLLAPSKSPNRTEQIIIMGTTVDDRNNVASFEIGRDKDNNIVLGKLHTHFVADNAKTNMENMLLAEFFKGFAMGYLID